MYSDCNEHDSFAAMMTFDNSDEILTHFAMLQSEHKMQAQIYRI